MNEMKRVVHGTQESAVESVSGNCRRAFAAKKWMVAIWCVRDDEKMELVGRTTYDFPQGGFAGCVELLKDNLDQEYSGPTLPEEPLPFADFLKKQVEEEREQEASKEKKETDLVTGTGIPPLQGSIDMVKSESPPPPKEEAP